MDGIKLIQIMAIKIKEIKDFKALIAYLCDILGWPIDLNSKEDDITFEYDPAELGIIEEDGKNTLIIKQLRPPKQGWPWGIFYIDFTKSRLPVVLLRRTLKQFIEKKRGQNPSQAVWKIENLIFVCFFGSDEGRGTSMVYFIQHEHKLPILKVIAWDQYDTDRHIDAVEKNMSKLFWPADLSASGDWEKQWRSAFQLEHRYVIETSKQLSFELAKCASRIRKHILSAFKIERETGPLHKLYGDFKKILIHDLANTDFADMYAQTIAYGLFSARCMDDDGHFELAEIVERIPQTNPFLKSLLHQCMDFQGARKDCMDIEELGVAELVELLDNIDMKAIQDDFGKQKKGEDPVIHLYEGFMNEYDKKQKVKRGEFYTPDPVVSFIVRAVDSILMDKFGCCDGLADISTWGDLVEKGVIERPDWAQHYNSKKWKALSKEPFVQILDPATGTGTFLKHSMLQVYKNFLASNHVEVSATDSKQLWNDYVQNNLLPRLNGFELKMAPYAVAHMKIGMVLRELGYKFKEKKRLNVFMTNTLEEPHEYAGELFAMFLAKEANLADKIKKEKPTTVIIGNPPYSVSSANSSPYIEKLMTDYKEDVRSERNIQPLSDDYIKFIRFAHEKIKETGCGVIGMITNNSYLSGIIHRGMRKKLIGNFNKIYLLNLHGSSRIEEKTPDGSIDENVFDIQQGVSIALFVKYNNAISKTDIFYKDLYGLRRDKYDFLNANNINTVKWKILKPVDPYYFFVEKSFTAKHENSISVNDIFINKNIGIASGKDKLLVAFTHNDLIERFDLNNKKKLQLLLEDNSIDPQLIKTWLGEFAKANITEETKEFLYHPFDSRYLLYNTKILQRARYNLMRHMLSQDNIAIVCVRQAKNSYPNAFVTTKLTNRDSVTNHSYVFPLYINKNQEDMFHNASFSSNINQKTLSFCSSLYNKECTFEEIFYYIYAILYSPRYLGQYAEYLKIDFPKIPFVKDYKLFKELKELPENLLH